MQEHVILAFKEELMEAIVQHTVSTMRGDSQAMQETLAKLEEAYIHFRYINPPKELNGY